MPLLLCPNDSGPMTTVNRAGVEFDMCPACRGVWLDRGELEKLMAITADDNPGHARRDQRAAPHEGLLPPDRARDVDRRDWKSGDDRHRHKKRLSSLFDIFD